MVPGGCRAESQHGFVSRRRVLSYRPVIAGAGLPYVFGKSTTVNPPRHRSPIFHGTSATAGNRVGRTSDLPPLQPGSRASGAFALTPSVSVGVPSHNYEFRGESALGPAS